MKLKKLAQILIVSCGILALSACHTTKNMEDQDEAASSQEEGGAQSSGIGDNESYGRGGKMTREQLLHKRTYYFDFDRSDVHDEDKPAIIVNAQYLVAHPRTRVIIEGHTDPRGSREYNVALAERRAVAVANILKAKGVSPSQIRVVSYGAERLASQGRTERDFQLDRRAIIVYQ